MQYLSIESLNGILLGVGGNNTLLHSVRLLTTYIAGEHAFWYNQHLTKNVSPDTK